MFVIGLPIISVLFAFFVIGPGRIMTWVDKYNQNHPKETPIEQLAKKAEAQPAEQLESSKLSEPRLTIGNNGSF